MKTLTSFAVFMLFWAVFAQAQTIDFSAGTSIDYGKIAKGADGYRTFTFSNKGNAPLIIIGAKPSCGCTIPDYPKEPIMPGQTGIIKVKYDTNRVGYFSKYVTIETNDLANAEVRLQILGTVEDEPAAVPTQEKTFQH